MWRTVSHAIAAATAAITNEENREKENTLKTTTPTACRSESKNDRKILSKLILCDNNWWEIM